MSREDELLAALAQAKAETARLQRETRLTKAAIDRGLSGELLAMVNRDDRAEETIIESLDHLKQLVDRQVQTGVEERFRQGGRSPHVTREVRTKSLDDMTPAEINRDWPKIQERLKRGGR